MRRIITVILSAFLLSNCGDIKKVDTSENNSRELVPEPDKAERLRYEALQRLRTSGCEFLNPDTSILPIKIRDAKSGKNFIGNEKPGSGDEYRFYSNNFQQLLSLTQHSGDGQYQISIFKVGYAKKEDYRYKRLDVDTIKTEKGIRLGMSKADVVSRLGNCYAALDSSKNYIELYYRIETPKDTKTNLLGRHNMPIYYASYKIRNGGLEAFEFGFDYP
ncbi:hypothetical protein [Foetidibacter luteolus]|uniref:hypothetical protein n=1 Tax=Foetidibacter luteolus TaxID=2608880 RepID=UPI00129BE054|nr:hypothetical protein [Foetidibacter luteolus]